MVVSRLDTNTVSWYDTISSGAMGTWAALLRMRVGAFLKTGAPRVQTGKDRPREWADDREDTGEDMTTAEQKQLAKRQHAFCDEQALHEGWVWCLGQEAEDAGLTTHEVGKGKAWEDLRWFVLGWLLQDGCPEYDALDAMADVREELTGEGQP